MEEKCETCKYFVDRHCHRHPPVVLLDADVANARFPFVDPTDTCGEWTARKAAPAQAQQVVAWEEEERRRQR
jgi:hypothetical protein